VERFQIEVTGGEPTATKVVSTGKAGIQHGTIVCRREIATRCGDGVIRCRSDRIAQSSLEGQSGRVQVAHAHQRSHPADWVEDRPPVVLPAPKVEKWRTQLSW
jgi:hypothetical protein